MPITSTQPGMNPSIGRVPGSEGGQTQLALDLGPRERKRCCHAFSPPFADSKRPGAGRTSLWPIEPGWRADCPAATPGRARHAAAARTAPAGGQSAAQAPGDATQCRGSATPRRTTTATPGWAAATATAPSGPAAAAARRPAPGNSGPGQSCCRRGRRRGRRRRRGWGGCHCRRREAARTHPRPITAPRR